jgi:hypothetical protein
MIEFFADTKLRLLAKSVLGKYQDLWQQAKSSR